MMCLAHAFVVSRFLGLYAMPQLYSFARSKGLYSRPRVCEIVTLLWCCRLAELSVDR